MNSPAERLEWAVNRCREAGLRLTHSRLALLGGLALQTAPVTLEQLRQEAGGVCDFATVYRAIRLFENADVVRHLGLHQRFGSYVLLAPGEHLDFLVCRDCGSVSEVENAQAVRELEHQIAARSGFSGLYHELEFYGTCPGCQQSRPGASQAQSA